MMYLQVEVVLAPRLRKSTKFLSCIPYSIVGGYFKFQAVCFILILTLNWGFEVIGNFVQSHFICTMLPLLSVTDYCGIDAWNYFIARPFL